MNRCLDADAMIAIGEALDWDVPDGLRHLHECDECRAQIDLLRVTRGSLEEREAVDRAVLQRVTAAVGVAARAEQARVSARDRWLAWVEPVLAGVTGLLVLKSSGVQFDTIGVTVLGFTLGAVLVILGRRVERAVFSRAAG